MDPTNHKIGMIETWQLAWKKPIWQSVEPSPEFETGDERNAVIAKGSVKIPISHSAALVSVTEANECIADYVSSLENGLDNVSIPSELKVDSNSSTSYLLTVTLLRTPTTRSQHLDKVDGKQHCVDLADSILLELVEHSQLIQKESKQEAGSSPPNVNRMEQHCKYVAESSNISTKCLKSRFLQWPPSTLSIQIDASESEHIPWWKRFYLSTQQSTSKSKKLEVGLVSAALVRVSRSNDVNEYNVANGIDVVQLMSFDGHQKFAQYPSEAILSDGATKNTINATIDGNQSSLPTNNLDLQLICVSSDGNVHSYCPWSLLIPNEFSSPENVVQADFTESMATFLFGTSLLERLNDSLLPLSKPMQSIRLSVPSLVRNPARTGSRIDSKGFDVLVTTGTGHNRSKQEKRNIYSMFDASVWNPAIDTTTWHNQTKNNYLTHCVSAFDYVAVAGCGIQRWKIFQEDRSQHSDMASGQGSDFATAATNNGQTQGTSTVNEINGHNDSSLESSEDMLINDSAGGFITFIALQPLTEVRTIFLPFVPSHLSPFILNQQKFLYVTGKSSQGQHAVAIAMCTTVVSDASVSSNNSNYQANLPENANAKSTQDSCSKDIEISRFQIFHVAVPTSTTSLNWICSENTTSAPVITLIDHDDRTGQLSVTQRALSTLKMICNQSHYCQDSRAIAQVAVMNSYQSSGQGVFHVLPSFKSTMVWCKSGQGWCILGFADNAYFVCFEGSSVKRDAFILKLSEVESERFAHGIACSVLPLDPLTKVQQIDDEKLDANAQCFQSTALLSNGQMESRQNEATGRVSNIAIVATDSIPLLGHRDDSEFQSPLTPRLNHEQRARMLLNQSASWVELDRINDGFCSQVPCVSIRVGNDRCSGYLLSLRRIVVENGSASPSKQVLSWLCEQQEFFIASSLALDLLNESDLLIHLWRSLGHRDEAYANSYLEGLLDGVIRIEASNQLSTLRQLSDMTIVCLAKGGFSMSSTLALFLERNKFYDPYSACLVLAALASFTLSNEEELSVARMSMGTDCPKPLIQSEQKVWPVQCLLKVGVSRDYLSESLNLLNSTIPDKLRNRNDSFDGSIPGRSLELCRHLVSLIVRSADVAAGLLLDLLDDNEHIRFWQSLDIETQLSISLIDISGTHPLLRELEIRTWALDQIKKCTELEISLSTNISIDVVPSSWLQRLTLACLVNAGCRLSYLSKVNDAFDEIYDEDTMDAHIQTQNEIRLALIPAHGTGGLDFDLIISSLLILEHRKKKWSQNANLSTRFLLNAVCTAAGHRDVEEPRFALDASSLMRLCALLGDVESGSKLVGGRSGLILECCNILIAALGMGMEEAEYFLLSKSVSSDKIDCSIGIFQLKRWHVRILWLMEDHVLRIRTYGEFETKNIRGKVDPVLAATICFRTWWAISRHAVPASSEWLTGWLQKRLCVNENLLSPHRLACAAIVRALIWPSSSNGPGENVLASLLAIDARFLVQLSLSCCGLAESVPNFIIEDLFFTRKEHDLVTQQDKEDRGTISLNHLKLR